MTLLAPAAPLAHGRSRPHGGDPAGAAAELLADSRRRRGAWRNRLRVWIGYPWAHAQVLPWQVTLGGGDHQWEAYARALMRERGVAGPLRLRLDAGRHGRARLAFGIDAGLLDALERMASAGGWRLWSCHDLLSSCLARHRTALRDSGGLVLAETGALSCLWRSAQGWEDLITLRRDPGQSLETLLSAAELLCGARAERLSLVVPVRAGCAALAGRLALAGRAASHAGGGGMKARTRGMADFARRAGLNGACLVAGVLLLVVVGLTAWREWSVLACAARSRPWRTAWRSAASSRNASSAAGWRNRPRSEIEALLSRQRAEDRLRPAILRAVEKAWSPRVAMLGLKLEAGGKAHAWKCWSPA